MMKKKKNYMATAGIITILVIVAIIVVNILFSAIGTKVNLKIDMTRDKILSFDDATIAVLDKLDEEVKVYSMIPDSSDGTVIDQVREILEKYSKLTSKIDYKVIDTEKNPDFARKYSTTGAPLSVYSVVFETDKRFKTVNLSDAILTDSTGQTIQSIAAEKLFTSAIMHVTSDKIAKLAVLEGHGELVGASYFSEMLKYEGYEVVPLNLMTDDIPEDIDSIIVTSPEKDFDAGEIDKIDDYLNKGKSLQVISTPGQPALQKYDSYLKEEWGIEFKPGFLAEDEAGFFYKKPIYLLPKINETEITADFIGKDLMVICPASMGIKKNENQNVKELVLLETSDECIVKVSQFDDMTADYHSLRDGDKKEISTVASIVSKELSDGKTARIFVSGGIDFLQQSLMESSFANKDFYFNTIAAICENNNNIYIRPKDISTPYITISALWVYIFGFITVVVIPLSLLIAGLVIWLRRRHL